MRMIRQLFFLKGLFRYRHFVESGRPFVIFTIPSPALLYCFCSFDAVYTSNRDFAPLCCCRGLLFYIVQMPRLNCRSSSWRTPAFEVPMHTCYPCSCCLPMPHAHHPRKQLSYPKRSTQVSGNQCVKIHAVCNCHIVVIYRFMMPPPSPARPCHCPSSSGSGCGVSHRDGLSFLDVPGRWRCVG